MPLTGAYFCSTTVDINTRVTVVKEIMIDRADNQHRP